MSTLGDFDASAVIYGKFTTYKPTTGAPFTLAGSPALSVYKDNSTTQSTTGVTLTADFDSVTGLGHFAIDTSADGTFYSAGSFFDIVITTGTVDGVSAVGTVVASFTIRKSSALKPTVAARTLDVSAGGEAGVDWANVGSPTTTVGLSGTTVKTATDVETDTQDIQSRLPTALVSGRIDASVGAMVADVLTSSALAASAVTEIINAIWDEALAGHAVAGSSGAALSGAGSAGDPWTTALPGAYGAGTAGKIIGDNINATVSSRASQTSVDTIDDFVDTEVSAIKTKTDQLTFTVANQLDCNVITKTGFALTSAYDFAKGTTAMVESYAANTVAPSPAQALFAIHQMLSSFAITGTSYTARQLDNTTTAFVATLDSATTPTAISRA